MLNRPASQDWLSLKSAIRGSLWKVIFINQGVRLFKKSCMCQACIGYLCKVMPLRLWKYAVPVCARTFVCIYVLSECVRVYLSLWCGSVCARIKCICCWRGTNHNKSYTRVWGDTFVRRLPLRFPVMHLQQLIKIPFYLNTFKLFSQTWITFLCAATLTTTFPFIATQVHPKECLGAAASLKFPQYDCDKHIKSFTLLRKMLKMQQHFWVQQW